jgi:Tfp pilus assembly protein PilF
MANAVIAYDAGNTARAQQLLDQLFEHTQSLPAAAVLRSQIAIQDGNLQFAHRLLQQQIRLAPDNGALREAYGAALYLNGDLVTARQELTTAARRGAPRWRIAYHLGLIDEAENDFDSAKQHYREALDGNPDWAPARMRLNALE